MIEDLLEWNDWDQFGSLIFCYYNCTIKSNIGKDIKVGDSFEVVNVDYEDGTIEFFSKSEDEWPIHSYNMKLTFETE